MEIKFVMKSNEKNFVINCKNVSSLGIDQIQGLVNFNISFVVDKLSE